MSFRNLLIVESPNKTAKVESILGEGWKVVASKGHVRDLPERDIAISEPDYRLRYEVQGKSHAIISALKQLAGQAEKIYLATDPDREGEAIAWHLKDALGIAESKYERVTFTEIVESAVRAGVAAPRRIDMGLVHAQEARRALDRIVGYKVSPILWDALGSLTSAGRVQSPAVRLVYEREKAIEQFTPTKHFTARLGFGEWAALWQTKPHLSEGQDFVLDQSLARRAASCTGLRVVSSETKVEREQPPAPFNSVNLLRAASVRLELDPDEVMSLAQKLFEGAKQEKEGHITYHRTDAVNLSTEAVGEIRTYARAQGWKVPAEPRRFKESADAQAGHEGIRPSHIEQREAGQTPAERALYKLVWERAVASQLEAATYNVTTLVLQGQHDGQTFEFRATGRVLLEPGWRVVSAGDATEEESDADDADAKSGKVPALAIGATIDPTSGDVVAKMTRAPSRFTKASLLETLEKMGIGRPSTFASIIKNISDRGYIEEKARKLYCGAAGAAVIEALMTGEFAFLEYGYTRGMEEELDAVAKGQRTYRQVVAGMDASIVADIRRVTAAGTIKPLHSCPKCGRALRRVKGASGTFWSCSGYREQACDVAMDDVGGKPVERKSHPCPSCGAAMYRRKGSFGFFWGCSGFKEGCKEKLPDNRGKPGQKPKVSEHSCKACGSALVRRTKAGKNGYDFFSCTGYPNCKETYGVSKAGEPTARGSS